MGKRHIERSVGILPDDDLESIIRWGIFCACDKKRDEDDLFFVSVSVSVSVFVCVCVRERSYSMFFSRELNVMPPVGPGWLSLGRNI